MRTYYIILSAGVPVDVTHLWNQAQIKLREWTSRDRGAEIVECVPLQTEFDFVDEEGTEPDFPAPSGAW